METLFGDFGEAPGSADSNNSDCEEFVLREYLQFEVYQRD